MALHAPQVHGFFGVPVDHLTAIGELADHFRGSDLSNAVVVSPDLGNAKTANQFARLLGVPVAAGSKQRLADDRVVIEAIVGDVAGRRAIVLDDEIATGSSIVQLARPARGRGVPVDLGRVHARAVHRQGRRAAARRPDDHRGRHDGHGAAADRRHGPTSRCARSPTLFAEAIHRSHIGESVSSLFDGVDPAYAPPQQRLPFDDPM